MGKRKPTPSKYYAVHVRLTEAEMEDFLQRVSLTGLSQSEYIRHAIFHSSIQFTIAKECSLDQLEDILAQLGKIGSNLNQIARYFNSGGSTASGLESDLKNNIHELESLKYEILKIVGDAYGNHKTHRK